MKNIITFSITLLVLAACKKPETGDYALTLTYDQSNLVTTTIYGHEYKVTAKHVFYGGTFGDISGVLERKKNKVSGVLTLFSGKDNKKDLTVDGKIEGDGFHKHKVSGNFTDSIGTGKFKINFQNS